MITILWLIFLFLFQFGFFLWLFGSQLIYCQLLIFFGWINQYFSCGVFGPRFVRILHQKFFNAIKSSWKNPINWIFVLNFWIISYYDKTTNIFVCLFCIVNTLFNILLICLNVGFGISTIFMYFSFLLNYFFLNY